MNLGNQRRRSVDSHLVEHFHEVSCLLAAELISARLDDELHDGAEAQALDRHLERCDSCRALCSTLAATQRRASVRSADPVDDRSAVIAAAVESTWRSVVRRRAARRRAATLGSAVAAGLIVLGSVALLRTTTDTTPASPHLSVSHASLTPADTGHASVLTFAITNDGGTADSLVEVDLPATITGDVALHVVRHQHEHATETTMQSVDELSVVAGGTKVFDESSSHVMLIDLVTPLEHGDHVPVTFRFGSSPPIAVDVTVG